MKKLLAIFIAFVTLFCVTGCGLFNKDNEKDKKYDVTIKVTSDQGGEWIFTPDIKELHIKIPYDGLERRFYVSQYQLKDHPEWRNIWFAPNGNNRFYGNVIYCPPGGKFQETDNLVKEKGEYGYTLRTGRASDLWNFRSIYFQITIE